MIKNLISLFFYLENSLSFFFCTFKNLLICNALNNKYMGNTISLYLGKTKKTE